MVTFFLFCAFVFVFLKMVGRMKRIAKIIRTKPEFQETASSTVVSCYRFAPALIATKERCAPKMKNIKHIVKTTLFLKIKIFCVDKILNKTTVISTLEKNH